MIGSISASLNDWQACRSFQDFAAAFPIAGMKTIDEIRLENLETMITESGNAERLAGLADSSGVYISQLKNRAPDRKTGKRRQIGDAMARRLEVACGKPPGWMDHEHNAGTYRQQQLDHALRVMEKMPSWQLDKTLLIIDAMADPPSPELAPPAIDYSDPASYPKAMELRAKQQPTKARDKKA